MKKKKLFIVLKILFIILGCQNTALAQENATLGAEAYLSLNTWSVNERYNASHMLMVPLYYAYKYNDESLKEKLDENIERFLKEGKEDLNIKVQNEKLSGLQYLYFLSEYADLSNNKTLANYLFFQIKGIWTNIPAQQWERKPFNNMRERLDWKLQANKKDGYKRIIIDEELFTFGIASNLIKFYPKEPVLKEINYYALEVFKQRSSLEYGRWLFDKGSYDNYKDHAYAGYNNKIVKGKKPLKDMVADSSHFFRMPKILLSLQSSYPINSDNYNLYKNFREGLTKQFLDKVVKVENNRIYLTNYMDGRNGIYRWEYPSLGKGNGYGPYGLTSSFGMGWWSFLENQEVRNLYLRYYRQLEIASKTTLCPKIFNLVKNQKHMTNRKQFNECIYLYNSYMASKI
ncbi:hypothetical protein [Acinetobacter pittii]|uniref:hypothetical protein n=1 Tax=Acinetobacter pittii TaxID=48296 RepID=UPI001F0621E6|nr:hypothetical protein [Acinetobacter pittii]MCH2072688.1 hypothetical protein [Acinetobacter pittii]